MTGYSITNLSTGKKMTLSEPVAKKFFGATDEKKFVMCLPCTERTENVEEKKSFTYEIVKTFRKKKVKGTCVIRMGGLGDLILLSSGLRQIKEPLTIATLPQNIPFMKSLNGWRIISIADIGKYNFDKVIDLRWAVEPKEMGTMCHGEWSDYTLDDRSDSFDKLLGVYPAKKIFKVPIKVKALKKVANMAGHHFVAINASMVASARSIPIKYIKPLCSKIKEPVVLFGQSQSWNQELKEYSTGNVVNLIDKTTLDEMIAIIALSKLVITPDTSSLHIAAALGKPTLALFGNINPRTRVSYYPTVRSLYPQGELPCIPCWDLHPCQFEPKDGTKCMKLLTPIRIAEAVRENLNGPYL